MTDDVLAEIRRIQGIAAKSGDSWAGYYAEDVRKLLEEVDRLRTLVTEAYSMLDPYFCDDEMYAAIEAIAKPYGS